MRPIVPPPVPYGATARRPEWHSLPAELRAAIAARLGWPVVAAASAGGGFTTGFASVLEASDGRRAFVKAARLPEQRHLADWYAREVAVTAALPPEVPAARPRWTLTAAGHFVICLDAIDGRVPALPWSPAELRAALDSWAVAAAALREPPAGLLAARPPRLADLLRGDLSYWQWARAGQVVLPPLPPAAADHMPELAALEAALPGYVDTPALTHGDLRVDNVLIGAVGQAWLCDWTWLCAGAPWFDTANLLVTAYASGLDAGALFAAHPTARGAPPDALDAALAALSGYWLFRAADPAPDASPHQVAHQSWSGRTALSWLCQRRWPPTPGS